MFIINFSISVILIFAFLICIKNVSKNIFNKTNIPNI